MVNVLYDKMANTTKTVLPLSSKILNELTCSECDKYLSVGPVLLHNRNIICGRKTCINEEDDEGTKNKDDLHFSIYDILAEHSCFKCINHFNGCRKILLFGEAEEHENKCELVYVYNCSYCVFEGNGYEFIQHLRKHHAEHLATEVTFQINLEKPVPVSKQYFYNPNAIFGVETRVTDNELEIRCYHENNNVLHNCKNYKINIFTSEDKVNYTSAPVSLTHVDETISNTFKISIEELKNFFKSDILLFRILLNESTATEQENFNFMHNFNKSKKRKLAIDDNYKPAIRLIKNSAQKLIKWLFGTNHKCLNCKKELLSRRLEMFVCSEWHITCSDCYAINKNCCCKNCEPTNQLINVKEFFENGTLSCDWQNCGKITNCSEYFFHRQVCAHRIYVCPLTDCTFEGTKSQLVSHWHSEDIQLICDKQKICNKSDFLLKLLNEHFYWIIDNLNEMLEVKVTDTIFVGIENRYATSIDINEKLVIFPYNFKLLVSFYLEGKCCKEHQFTQSTKKSHQHMGYIDAVKLSVNYTT